MFSWIGNLWGTTLTKVAGITIKVWMAFATGTVIVVATAGGAVFTNHIQHQESRLVVITINGISTSLDTSCRYDGDLKSPPQTFLQFQHTLEQRANFTNPYKDGCPHSSLFSSTPRDIAEFSYATDAEQHSGHMMGGHWVPEPFSYCDVNTMSLDMATQHLAEMIDMYRSEYSNAQFALVGHSYGGLIALSGASRYIKKHPGVITSVITLDSPLHGRNLGAAGLGFDALNDVLASLHDNKQCSPSAANDLGETLMARAAMSSNSAELETGVLTDAGVRVATLGNADDCLYQQSMCFSALDLTLTSAIGVEGLLATSAILTIPNQIATQSVTNATQHQLYTLGHDAGILPDGALVGGHGAILTNQPAIDDIVFFIMQKSTDEKVSQTSTPSATSLPLNTVDWKNTTYILTCTNGPVIITAGTGTANGITVAIMSVIYGNLTGQLNAIIVVQCADPQGQLLSKNGPPYVYTSSHVVIFGGTHIAPQQIADIPSSDDTVNCTNFTNLSNLTFDPYTATVMNTTLLLDGGALSTFNLGIQQNYQWNGQRFVVISSKCYPNGGV